MNQNQNFNLKFSKKKPNPVLFFFIQMIYPLLCGASNHQEEENDGGSPVCSPRKSKRKIKDTKNPYSTRGLDQYSALLAELEEKKQKIYSRVGSQSIVRFVYKNSNDCVPVVVNLKDIVKTKPEKTQDRHVPDKPSESDKNTDMNMKNNKRFSWKNVGFMSLKKPCYYMLAVIVLILLFLMFFGRSVVILCTCIGWYIVPTINGEGSNLRMSTKKKDYVRRSSGKSSLHHRN